MADERPTDQPAGGTREDEVAIDFIKAANFAVLWADGAIGSVTSHGLIHVAFYSERPAIPRRQVFRLNAETGELGDLIEEKTIGRDSYVRELSCDVMMTPESARSLGTWLLQLSQDSASGGGK